MEKKKSNRFKKLNVTKIITKLKLLSYFWNQQPFRRLRFSTKLMLRSRFDLEFVIIFAGEEYKFRHKKCKVICFEDETVEKWNNLIGIYFIDFDWDLNEFNVEVFLLDRNRNGYFDAVMRFFSSENWFNKRVWKSIPSTLWIPRLIPSLHFSGRHFGVNTLRKIQ